MEKFSVILATISLIIWLYLILLRGRFWWADQVLKQENITLSSYPSICGIIPARNEAEALPISLPSLLKQDYSGELNLILIDDQSTDRTGEIAQEIANKLNYKNRLKVISGKPLPLGWTGKLWAMEQGIKYSQETALNPDYYLLTDADIAHDTQNLKNLVNKAATNQLALVSLMVLLKTSSFWEKLLIPAFVFFFAKLYPFPLVNNPKSSVAAAAGGCILIRRDILEEIGGIAILKQALIDDCTLAGEVKSYLRSHPERPQQGIWLGLTTSTQSLRDYPTLKSIWDLVARTAFTQLQYSPLLLFGSVLGMVLTYLIAPLGILNGLLTQNNLLLGSTILTLTLMTISYIPTLRLYKLGWYWALTLPLIALLYTLMTIDSARRYWQGKGGNWKGRVYSQTDLEG
jgi:hopene-associated glycosyltransferase HpnB